MSKGENEMKAHFQAGVLAFLLNSSLIRSCGIQGGATGHMSSIRAIRPFPTPVIFMLWSQLYYCRHILSLPCRPPAKTLSLDPVKYCAKTTGRGTSENRNFLVPNSQLTFTALRRFLMKEMNRLTPFLSKMNLWKCLNAS